LDLMLPSMSGLEVCKGIKSWSASTPVVVLSAVSEVADKVLLLELGADDYVTKPFSPRELMARVQAAIRRTQKPATNTHVSFGNVTADFSGMEVFKDGVPVLLTAHEIKLLQYFVEHAERVITREELLNDVWNYTSYPTTRTVDNHIMKLRQKLEADPAKPVYFRTIHGIGYKFVRGN
jgi:DNA-binding response OmpR family regulator